MFKRQDNRYQYSVPEKTVDSSALAAASALGRALHPDGKTVDHTKIPQYNQPSRSASVRNLHKVRSPAQNTANQSQGRHSSLTNNGRTKIITTTTTATIKRSVDNEKRLQSRTKSITKSQEPESRTRSIAKSHDSSQSRTRSITNKSHEHPPSQKVRNSVSSNNLREYHRSSSLPTKIHSTLNITRRQQHDANRAFADFDDPEFVDASDSIPVRLRTTKKYIPGPNGLIAINVPVSEPITYSSSIPKKKSARSSLRSSQTVRTNLDSHTSSNSLTNSSKPKSKIKRSSSMNQLPHDKIAVRTTHDHKSNDQLATHSKRASSLTNRTKNLKYTNIIETSMPEENETTPEAIEVPKKNPSGKPGSRYNSLGKNKAKKSLTKSSAIEQSKVSHKNIEIAKSSSHLKKLNQKNRLSKAISEDFADFADDSLITNYDKVRPIVLEDEQDNSVIRTDLSKSDSLEGTSANVDDKVKPVPQVKQETVANDQEESPDAVGVKKEEPERLSEPLLSQQLETSDNNDVAAEIETVMTTEIVPNLNDAIQLLDDSIKENASKQMDDDATAKQEPSDEVNNLDTLINDSASSDGTEKVISSGTAVEEETQLDVDRLLSENLKDEHDHAIDDDSIVANDKNNHENGSSEFEHHKDTNDIGVTENVLEGEEKQEEEDVPIESEHNRTTTPEHLETIGHNKDVTSEQDAKINSPDVPVTPSVMSINEFHTPVVANSNNMATPMSNNSEYMSTEDINLRNSVENIIDSMDVIDADLEESLNSPIETHESTFKSDTSVNSKNKAEKKINQKVVEGTNPSLRGRIKENMIKSEKKEVILTENVGLRESVSPVRKTHNNLAQHLRSANPYLTIPPKSSKRLEDKKKREQERKEKAAIKTPATKKDKGTVQSPSKTILEVPQHKLTKVVTPIKSALKNNGAVRSNTSSVYSDYSPAEGAYLSLTTAENTRLNANIPETISPPRRQNTAKRYARPQSMVARVQQRSSSPTTKEKTRLNRNSTIERRSSQLKTQPNTLYANEPLSKSSLAALHSVRAASVAVQPNGTNQSISKSVKQPIQQSAPTRQKNTPRINVHKRESMIEKKPKKTSASTTTVVSHTKANGIDPNMVGVLYPREPPQKKSSFEKLRNSDSHLGFKMMSLRDEILMGENSQQNETQDVNQNNGTHEEVNVVSDLLRSGGWTSRFQDSDSDDDFADKFSGSKGSSKVSSPSKDTKSKLANGFSMFKSKPTTDHQEQNHHSNYHVHPPYVGQQQQQSQRSVSTPNNLSKNSVRNGDGYTVTVDNNRVLSNQHYPKQALQQGLQNDRRVQSGIISNGNPGRMSERSLTKSDRPEDHDKKQGSFGKKLKKIFGRKKTDV